MILLNNTQSIELVLAGAVTASQLDFVASFTDIGISSNGTSGFGSESGTSNNANPVTLLTTPAVGQVRKLQYASVYNNDTVSAAVTVSLNDNGVVRELVTISLLPNNSLQYTSDQGWYISSEANNAIDPANPPAWGTATPNTGAFTEVIINDSVGAAVVEHIRASNAVDKKIVRSYVTGSGAYALSLRNDANNVESVILQGIRAGIDQTLTEIRLGFTDKVVVHIYDNLTIATAGKGIDFSAAGGGLLADYREGNILPILRDEVGNLATMAIETGKFVRVGKVTHWSVYMSISSKGAMSGALELHGMPFFSSSSGFEGAASAFFFGATSNKQIGAIIFNNNDYFRLRILDSAGGYRDLLPADITDSFSLIITGTYRTQ